VHKYSLRIIRLRIEIIVSWFLVYEMIAMYDGVPTPSL
jgi:hypothetical protein